MGSGHYQCLILIDCPPRIPNLKPSFTTAPARFASERAKNVAATTAKFLVKKAKISVLHCRCAWDTMADGGLNSKVRSGCKWTRLERLFALIGKKMGRPRRWRHLWRVSGIICLSAHN